MLICKTVFLDVIQAFENIWYNGLLFKLKVIFPLKSYLEDRYVKIIIFYAVLFLFILLIFRLSYVVECTPVVADPSDEFIAPPPSQS